MLEYISEFNAYKFICKICDDEIYIQDKKYNKIYNKIIDDGICFNCNSLKIRHDILKKLKKFDKRVKFQNSYIELLFEIDI